MMKRLFAMILTCCLLLSLASPPFAAATDQDEIPRMGVDRERSSVTDAVYSDGQDPAIYEALIRFNDVKKGVQQLGSKIRKWYQVAPVALVGGLTQPEWEALEQDDNVAFIEPNAAVFAASDGTERMKRPSVPVFSSPAPGGSGVKVAVLDTGIHTASSQLTVTGGVSFVADEPDMDDENGHGTAVAGVIAAQGDGLGTRGLAPQAELYAVKVLDRTGQGTYSQVLDAIEWSMAQGMQIVVMSFGGTVHSQALEAAVNAAADQGILLVAPTGNEGIAGVQVPARYPAVLAVGAVDAAHQLALFSNTGTEVDVVAPGVDVPVLDLHDDATAQSGTSFAAAYAAGAFALAKQKYPEKTAGELVTLLQDRTRPITPDPRQGYGHGVIDLQLLLADPPPEVPDVSEIWTILTARKSVSALTPSEQSVIETYYALTVAELREGEKQGLSLHDAIEAITRTHQYGLDLPTLLQLREQVDEWKQLDKPLTAYQSFVNVYAIAKADRALLLDAFMQGATSLPIYAAYTISQALGIPFQSLLLTDKESLATARQSLLEPLSEDESQALTRLAQTWPVRLEALQAYREAEELTWQALSDQIERSMAHPDRLDAGEGGEMQARASSGPEPITYDKYMQAPFSINSDQESIQLSSGDVNLDLQQYVLPGRNGLDVELGLRYDSSQSHLYEARYEVGWGEYTDYDYLVEGGAYAYWNNWVGPGRYPPLDVPLTVIGDYEEMYQAEAAADNWVDQSYYIEAYWADGTDLFLEYYAYIYQYYDPVDSYSYSWENNATASRTYTEKQSHLGAGWSLAFASIEFDWQGERYLHLPSGAKYRIQITSQTDDSNLDKYTLKDLRLELDSGTYTNAQGIHSAYVLIQEDGTKQYFASDGRLLGIRDRENNTISFEHQTIHGHPVIAKITDTIGRVFTFTYSTPSSTEKKVVVTLPDDHTIEYISEKLSGYTTDEYVLKTIIDQKGRQTQFNYDVAGCNAKFSFFSKSSLHQSNPMACLTEITYPTGAQTLYTYEKATGNLGSRGAFEYYRVKTREDKADQNSYHKQTYAYTNNYSGYPTYSNATSLPTSFRYFTTVTDQGGTETQYTFTREHTVEKATTRNGTQSIEEVGYTYNTDKLPTAVTTKAYNLGTTNAASITESYTYDGWGNVLTYTDPLGHTVTSTYNTSCGQKTSEERNMNASTVQRTEWTVNGTTCHVDQIKQSHVENGQSRPLITSYSYDTYGNVTQTRTQKQDSSQITVNYTYDPSTSNGYKAAFLTGITQTVQNADQVAEVLEQSFTYEVSTGKRLSVTDGNGATTQYQYDELGRLRLIIRPARDPANPVVTKQEWMYHDATNTLEYRDETQVGERYVYDKLGRPIQYQTFQNGQWLTREEVHYNARGQVEWTKNAAQQQTQYQYDVRGRLVQVTYPDQTFQTWTYKDAWLQEGNTSLVEFRDEDGRLFSSYYDKLGRKVADRMLDTVRYEYDYVGNLIRVTDAKGEDTVYGYDDLNRLTSVRDALLKTTSYAYDLQGNLIQTTFPGGAFKRSEYDDAGRMLSTTDESGQVETYDYDRNGNRIRKIDRAGQTTVYTYNRRNELEQVTVSQGSSSQSKQFAYDAAGRRVRAQNEVGTFQYAYREDNGELTKLTYPDGRTVELDWNPEQMYTKLKDPFGQAIYTKFDQRGRLDYVALGSLTNPVREAKYTYTPNGKVAEIAFANGTRQQYGYKNNAAHRLESVTHWNGTSAQLGMYTYGAYDKNFNITQQTTPQGSATYSYDELNRIETSSDGGEVYTYDARGNRLTLQSHRPFDLQEASYAYDHWNQLVTVHTAEGQVTYTYDPDGLLYERVSGSERTRYYYWNGLLIAEGTVNGGTGSATLQARYLYGATGPITRMDGSGNKQYYLTNGHGDVVQLRNVSGALMNAYQYDIWGNPQQVSETVANPFRYSGEYWDEETGLQYLRARWYDPNMGRFLSEDPYKGDPRNPLSLNLYTYVENNPVLCFLLSKLKTMVISNKSA